MNPFAQLKQITSVFLFALTLACFGFLPAVQAVSPPPDGGYPGGNTAEGQAALLSRTTGGFNTAVGFLSLRSDTTGSFNTAVGAGTLLANTADENTATGAAALLSTTTAGLNTADGAFALFSNTTGDGNTATGDQVMFSNTIGRQNTAIGEGALRSNTSGSFNTAIGSGAISSNTTGDRNVALGETAGLNATGSSNVYIGAGMLGVAGEANSCYIASIFGQASAGGIPVFINSSSKLGTATSSKRFKERIKPMDKSSEALFSLKPVTFRYKKELDPQGIQQLGLVAEDVEKVNPDLVVRDKEGKPYSVRYDQVNAMLLNEFLKEHRQVQELKKQVAALTAGLQNVSAQLEVNKPAPQTVLNDR